jgi:hypothetical protein
MMLLQSTQFPAELPSHGLKHSQPHGYVCLFGAVTVLGNRGETHADNAVFRGDLSDQIYVNWRDSIVEYHQPVGPIFDLAYRSKHFTTSEQTRAA